MSNDVLVPILVAILGMSPGLVALFIQYRRDKHRQPQEEVSEGMEASETAAKVVSEYSREMREMRKEMQELRDKVQSLERQIKEKDALIEKWTHGIERLVAQIVSLGHTPVWKPRAEKE